MENKQYRRREGSMDREEKGAGSQRRDDNEGEYKPQENVSVMRGAKIGQRRETEKEKW